jgi:hypothetical protein
VLDNLGSLSVKIFRESSPAFVNSFWDLNFCSYSWKQIGFGPGQQELCLWIAGVSAFGVWSGVMGFEILDGKENTPVDIVVDWVWFVASILQEGLRIIFEELAEKVSGSKSMQLVFIFGGVLSGLSWKQWWWLGFLLGGCTDNASVPGSVSGVGVAVVTFVGLEPLTVGFDTPFKELLLQPIGDV